MTYFFVFLLQTLLPTALLLACSWSVQPTLKFKSLVWLALCAFVLGTVLAAQLPVGQAVNFGLNGVIFCILLFFYVCQFFPAIRLNPFWHVLLLTAAALQWAKDPNIAAITATEVINTEFILHLSAIILGIMFCLFMAVWLFILLGQYKTAKKPTALRWFLMTALSLLLTVPLISNLLLTLMKLQVVELTKMRLTFVAKTGSLSGYFNYLNAIAIFLLLLCFTVQVYIVRKHDMQNETEPIEKRKKTAAYRVSRRIIGWGLAGLLLILGAQLYWDKMASQPPQLSEAVPVKADAQKNIHIPIAQVNDGKLHRFVWVADDGKAVRFFIINRLPARLSLGVVFDACLLCGDQGYVMQDDQVVCVGCGVRMFIPSIGKPGGCNPVPIENWRQTESEIIIPKASLEEGLNLFSTVMEIEVTDPVDGSRLTNTKTDYKYSHEEKTYFFRNEKNLELFRANPENYVPEVK